MTAAFDPTFPGDRELERRLEAFADLRLTPSGSATTQAKMQVMAVAHRRAALIEADRATGTFAAAGRRTPGTTIAFGRTAPVVAGTWTRPWLRPLGALTVAVMTLGLLAGTAAAARPGGPLYAALLDVERLTLPFDSTARAVAETRRLDIRLTEAKEAAQAGDQPAAVAALEAYSTIVVQAASEVDGDLGAARAIKAIVAGHASELASMLSMVSGPARAQLEAAIVDSTRFLYRIDPAL
jgi:hypothetical protein